MSVNPVSWFDIPVADLDRATAFYEAVFATQLQALPSEHGRQAAFPLVPGAPNTAGALVEHPGHTGASSSVTVYFACEDCALEQSRVAAAGGRVLEPKHGIGPFGFVARVCDSEGNVIGLHSRR